MIVEQRFKYLKFKLVKRQVLKDKHEVAFYTSFAILCCILLFTNFLPPCGDLFIICSAILQDYPHIRPFWFSFSQLLILVTSSECLISNSLSIVLVYPLAVLLLPAVVCLPSKCACICERQTDRQTDIHLSGRLLKMVTIQTTTHTHSFKLSLKLHPLSLWFQVGERQLEEMSDVLVLWWRRGLSEWLRRCQCAAPPHFNLNAIP